MGRIKVSDDADLVRETQSNTYATGLSIIAPGDTREESIGRARTDLEEYQLNNQPERIDEFGEIIAVALGASALLVGAAIVAPEIFVGAPAAAAAAPLGAPEILAPLASGGALAGPAGAEIATTVTTVSEVTAGASGAVTVVKDAVKDAVKKVDVSNITSDISNLGNTASNFLSSSNIQLPDLSNIPGADDLDLPDWGGVHDPTPPNNGTQGTDQPGTKSTVVDWTLVIVMGAILLVVLIASLFKRKKKR